MFLFWLRLIAPPGVIRPPLLQLPHWPRAGPVLLTLLSPNLQFLCPTEFCMIPYILFHQSGTPVRFQMVFCMHFCVWRCIPDISTERDVFHIHLLLCQLLLPTEQHSVDMSLCKLWEIVKGTEARHTAVHGVTKHQHHLPTEQQQHRKV